MVPIVNCTLTDCSLEILLYGTRCALFGTN
jgi:hypothetical protein